MAYELTPKELSELKGNEWINGRWYYDPYEIMRILLAKVQKARLDRPDLGREVVKIVNYQFSRITNLLPSAYADSLKIIRKKILALTPDVEQAKREERERIITEIEDNSSVIDWENDIGEMREFKEEFWQALKGDS